jgi:hypothetical protein
MMNKKRLTLLLTDAQIRIIKSKAAMAGMTGSQWVIDQLNLDTTLDDQVPDVDDVSAEFLTTYGDPGPDDTTLDDQDTPQADTTPHVDPDPQADPVQEPVTAQEAQDPAPGMVDQEDDTDVADPAMSEEDARAWQIVNIEREYPGPGNAQKRVDVLNESGVLLNGVAGQWTKRNASNAIRNARNYLGVKKP